MRTAAFLLPGFILTGSVLAAPPQQVILFSSTTTPVHAQLFVAHGDGTAERPLLPLTGMDYSASFSADGQWIIFTSERNGSPDIYRVHTDGTGLERLTDDPAFDDQAVLSPDGKTLAFVSSRGSGRAHLWLMDLATRRARLLTPNSGSDFRPAWSPDGQWLAFTSDRGADAGHLPGRWERIQSLSIYVVRPDGSGLRRITRGRGVAGSPRWSPDGKRIYYYETTELGAWYARVSEFAQGPIQIVSIDVADGTVTQHTSGEGVRLAPQPLPNGALAYLLRNAAGDGSLRVVQPDGSTAAGPFETIRGPSWSPDGKQVVYSKFTPSPTGAPEVLPAFSRDPGFRLAKLAEGLAFPTLSPQGDRIAAASGSLDTLVLMKPDGTDRRTVFVNKGGFAFAPSWSPDGATLAFSQGMYFRQGPHPSAQVSLIHLDGTGLHSIAPENTNSGFPSWSPDGKKIVYEQDGHLVIWTEATQARVNLTAPGAQRDNFPRWSPRGDWIEFTSDRDADEQFRIYLIHPDGTGLHKLTDSPGDAHGTWSPDGKSVVFSSGRMGFKDERALSETPQPYGELFIIDIDGTGLRQLTDNQWEEGTPLWLTQPPQAR